MNSRSVVVAFIGFVFMALFGVNRGQEFAPVPAPVLGNDGAAIDQGVAYLLLLWWCSIMVAGGETVEMEVVVVVNGGGSSGALRWIYMNI
ncbi:putative arabinogalactan protein/22/41 [Helianthus annuus]|uniref:Arabinogalactan protein 16/20/22/41 n=1 Tax=Helianthus annuus TaxID=4232 RepID=A0A251SPE2_HELAN|nr:putative arabinogalactan protein 16/20/22/41 [Helianthus annuus]KAJ0475648.1 putative arabinogalactan protein/22/41 [Helianthus annuus]KAJ0496431.1 putative arabinogalactan protein/22/41 [Helianthus annuus]KAJ0662489.1 putative arabinogalactan protein/22/41 [Helianthus annuus]KAJ0847806.1 putative arabinogalactan protein/22/41 [Helianthus annuus]